MKPAEKKESPAQTWVTRNSTDIIEHEVMPILLFMNQTFTFIARLGRP